MHLIRILLLLIIPILYLHKCTIYYKFIYLIVAIILPNRKNCKMLDINNKTKKREKKLKHPPTIYRKIKTYKFIFKKKLKSTFTYLK